MANKAEGGGEPGEGETSQERLGLLLSQIKTASAFPRASSRAAVLIACAALANVSPDFGTDDIDAREIVVGPGLIRVKGVRREGRTGGGTRNAITGFSFSARRRMLQTLGALDLSSVVGIPVVITLTYPADWREWCPTGRDAKAQLLSFRRLWARRWGVFAGVWKLEFQPRHSQPKERQLAPHFHILAVVPALDPFQPIAQATSMTDVRAWVSHTWWEVVGSQCDDHYLAGTRVDDADGNTPGRVVAYFAGYTAGRSKEEQHIAPHEWPGLGRFWGVVGIPRIEISVKMNDHEFFAVRRLLAELMARRSGRRRRSLSRYDDGLWLTLENAPELCGRIADWLNPPARISPRPLP